MSVNNVYNSNKINMVKLAMAKKTEKTLSDNKPEYMKMTGSIFNAPNAKSSTPASASSLADLNAYKSLNEMKNTEGTSSSSSNPLEDIESIDNAKDGKAAANAAEAEADNVRSLTTDTQNDAKTVNKFSSDAVKLNAQVVKDEKEFQLKLKKQEKEIKENNLQLEKLVKETEQAQTEIEDAQNELESLLGSNSFSIGNQKDGNNPNSDRIQELQNIIGTKIETTQADGRVIYQLQRSSTRTIRQMEVTSNNFIKAQNVNQNLIEDNQTKTDKVIETATTIEQVSALVSQTGQAVNYAGQGLVALATATFVAPPVASALIATGNVMQKVGTTTEMVGNYGQAAANVTKTAAYAADGNLLGALQSAAAAAQAGVAAGKSTADLQKNFKSIDAAAQQATQKAAANAAAKDTVKNMSAEELGGMSEKQARKAVSTDLQEQMAKGEIKGDSIEALKENSLKLDEKGNSLASKSFENSKTAFQETVTKAGYTVNDAGEIVAQNGEKISRKARRAIGGSFDSSFGPYASTGVKSSGSFWDKASKIGSNMQSLAALYGQYANQNNYYNNNTIVPEFQYDARTLDIIRKNQNRRNAISGMRYAV